MASAVLFIYLFIIIIYSLLFIYSAVLQVFRENTGSV
jgi:hypothetical protein